MRADRHYVDLLASRSPAPRERGIAVTAFDAPVTADVPGLVPLIDSVKQHGILQPLLVREREGRLQLIAGQRRLAAAIAAGLREVPCVVHDADDAAAEALRTASNLAGAVTAAPDAQAPVADATSVRSGEDLARSLSTATSLADLLSGPMSDLSRGIVGNLLRAELWRAATLVQSTRVVRGELPLMRGPVPVAQLVDKVMQGFAAERRMRHLEFVTHLDLPSNHIIIADEALLTAAFTGAVVATIAMVEGMQAGRVALVAGLNGSRQLTLVASQDHVLPSPAWAERAFDPEWTDRPGGAPVVLAMAAIARAARFHGGDPTATLSPRGSRIGLTIPAGA